MVRIKGLSESKSFVFISSNGAENQELVQKLRAWSRASKLDRGFVIGSHDVLMDNPLDLFFLRRRDLVSFDYDKVAKSNDHGSWWTSYADLFMMLSIVFLLMFVASSLRSGSAGFQQQQEFKKLARRAEDLEQQIKVYNTLKDQTLREQQNVAEQQVYQKLMDKLSLLKDEAHDEKVALQQKAKENEEKEFALNQYQQMVRNIINTNILAKSQIQHRDQVIVTRDQTIEEKKQQIAQMENTIQSNEAQISTINGELANKIQALRTEQAYSRSSKAALEKKIAAITEESQERVKDLQEKNQGIQSELGAVQSNLAQTEAQLGAANTTIAQQGNTIQQQGQEMGGLRSKLEADRGRYMAELDGLKKAEAEKLAGERAAYEGKLKKEHLNGEARAKKMAKFLADEQKKSGDLQGRINGLEGKIADTENQLRGTQSQLQGTQAQLQGTQAALEGTQGKLQGAEADKARALATVQDLKGDLERTRAIANARRQLAKAIADQLAKAGVKGVVDGRTGEVTLDFGGEYFDTGSTTLKPKMRSALDRFFPVYAKSLFSDPKVADKIANVEIVGFASSTYQNRYVNPKSTAPEDKDAIEYNLKLSFGRANSIFKHVLNEERLSQGDRDNLLPLMKVVGRGYLPDGKTAADLPDHMSQKEFCERFNCQKAQKVIVKFNMKD